MLYKYNSVSSFLESSYKSWVGDISELEVSLDVRGLSLDSPCVFIAYTNYGGDFYDRVAYDFVETFHNEDTQYLQQVSTCYCGYNVLFVGQEDDFGDMGDYIFNIFNFGEDFEDYYYNAEYLAHQSSFEEFLDYYLGETHPKMYDWALDKLMNRYSGQFRIGPDGFADFSYEDVWGWLCDQKRHP